MTNPYNKWKEWFRLRCDWHIDPEGWEAWNGAVQTVADYVANHAKLDGLTPTEIEELRQQILIKFTEPIIDEE